MNDQERYYDQLVDEALQQLPLEPVPREIYHKVLSAIEKPSSQLRFQLSWIDFSLSTVLALMVGFLLDLFRGLTSSPYWSARMRVELVLFWRDLKLFLIQNQAHLLAAVISLGTLFGMIIILAAIYKRQLMSPKRLAA